MATTSKSKSHHFLPVYGDTDSLISLTMDSDSGFEFDESDIYNSGRANSVDFRKSLQHGHASRLAKKQSSSPASMPVNVPDWSKILGNEYRDKRWRNSIDDDEGSCDGEMGGRVPPHEFLAKTRMASLSVQEGVGRTLKGRDLSRVRNAIWAKTGFQD